MFIFDVPSTKHLRSFHIAVLASSKLLILINNYEIVILSISNSYVPNTNTDTNTNR